MTVIFKSYEACLHCDSSEHSKVDDLLFNAKACFCESVEVKDGVFERTVKLSDAIRVEEPPVAREDVVFFAA